MAEPYVISLPAVKMPPVVRINSHAPLWRIIDALASSGWGELRAAPQSVRTYLLALGRVADGRTGVAETTDAQVSERTGLSVRTVFRARRWLIDYGLVTMLRRGARMGRVGVASILSLGKAALIELLPGARVAKGAREHRRAERDGGAHRLFSNMTKWRASSSQERKTAAPSVGRPRRSAVQEELISFEQQATTPESIAAIRARYAKRQEVRS